MCLPVISCASADPYTKATVFKTENFSVSRGELAYFTVHTMQSMLSSYTDAELIAMGYDKEKMPSEQSFDSTQTWLDHFKDNTSKYVEEVLMLCEAAKKENFTVDEAELEAKLASFKTDCEKKYGVDFKTYIDITYFGYADEEDYVSALRLEFLASSYMEALEKRLYDAIDQERIDRYIEENSPSASNEPTRNIEILVIPTNFNAEDILSEYPEKSFSEIAEANSNLKYYSYENCRQGELSEKIDAWLYDGERNIGDAETIDSNGKSLALCYVGDGLTILEFETMLALAKLDYNAYLNALFEEFPIIINKEALGSLVI